MEFLRVEREREREREREWKREKETEKSSPLHDLSYNTNSSPLVLHVCSKFLLLLLHLTLVVCSIPRLEPQVLLLLLTSSFLSARLYNFFFTLYINCNCNGCRRFHISGAAATSLVDSSSSVDHNAATATSSLHGHQLRGGRHSWLGNSALPKFLPWLGDEHTPEWIPYWRFSWYNSIYNISIAAWLLCN